MPYVIEEREGFIEVLYAGMVGYGERARAMRAVTEFGDGGTAPCVLSDFTYATAHEEMPGARADFIASVITAQWPKGSRVALVRLPEEAAKPAKHASAVQGPTVRTFQNRDDALAWLLEGNRPN